jgi:hypothetical protein
MSMVEDVTSAGCAGGRDSKSGVGLMMHSPASLYRVAAINPEQLQSFAGALKVVFLY